MLDTKKKYGKTEDEIMALVDPVVTKTTTWTNSQLSTERSRMQRYYDMQLPKRQHEGSSSYVSSDVYDGVESMKSQLLEVFGGNHDIIRFQPLGEQDVDVARLETSYLTYLIMDENHGFERFSDIIDDSLKGRNGVIEYYWEDKVDRDEHTVTAMPMDDVQALASQEDVELDLTLDEDCDPSMPCYSGTWTRVIDKSGLRIEGVPPEEYYSDGSKKDRRDGTRGRKTLKTRGELVKEGYDKEKVALLPTGNELEYDQERQERDKETNDFGVSNENAAQTELEQVMLYKSYVPLGLKGDGTSSLYRVIHGVGVLFEIDEVECDSFLEFVPLRRPHSQFGNNFAKRIVPTQNARSVIMRAVLDHTALTSSPKWTVLNNSLTNPKELLDRRMGGVVNTKRENAIGTLPYPQLSNAVFPTLELLKGNKEETTGISSLSQGLNKDAVSSQNSAGLVDNLITVSQTRQKIIARNFAMFLHDLFLACRKVVIDNQSRKKVFEFDNSFQNIDPKLWTPERKVQVSLHVGYGEQEKEAAKIAQLWGMLSQDPKASLFCPPEKQYKLLTDGMKKNGFANFADYIVTADQVKPPGPDPIEMQKLQIEDKKAQAALITAQAAATKVQGHHEMEAMKLQVNDMLAQIKQFVAQRDADRKDMDVANKVNVSQREIKLLEEAPPAAEKAIVSP